MIWEAPQILRNSMLLTIRKKREHINNLSKNSMFILFLNEFSSSFIFFPVAVLHPSNPRISYITRMLDS